MANQKDNSGALFKNDRKTNANQPDYKGSVQVDGRDYWISAWIKQGKQQKFMSLAFTLKDIERPTGGSHRPRTSQAQNDIPF